MSVDPNRARAYSLVRTAAAILRMRPGSAIMSISTILPSATVKATRRLKESVDDLSLACEICVRNRYLRTP